jgi:hypothetical protein
LWKLIHNLRRRIKYPQNVATFVIFKKLPKVNNRPLGENSPNLVTLFVRKIEGVMKCMLSSKGSFSPFQRRHFVKAN